MSYHIPNQQRTGGPLHESSSAYANSTDIPDHLRTQSGFNGQQTSSSLDAKYHAARSELFGRRPYHHQQDNNQYQQKQPIGASENPYSARGLSRQEGMMTERDTLSRVDVQLDEFLQRGKDVLDNLYEQRGYLQDTQRKLFDSASVLGLSRNTMGFIERRTTQDKFIFYGGAAFVLFSFWFIWKWLG